MSTAIRLTAAFAARYELVARNGVAGEELLEGVFADSVAPLLDGFDGWKESRRPDGGATRTVAMPGRRSMNMSDFAWFTIGFVAIIYLLCRPSIDVEKLRVAAEKVGEAIDREFEKRDKRINDLEYRIRVLEERNGRS